MKRLFHFTSNTTCRRPWVRVSCLALLAVLAAPARAATTAPFELQDGDRVLFMGDTFFEREVDYGPIETLLTAQYPDRSITFRNLAWAADTPLGRSRASFDWNKSEDDWLKRVKEQVVLVKPTVAFLSYAMTASFAGEAGIPRFKADMNKLMDAIDEVSGRKVKFVLLGPVTHERNFGTPSQVGAHNGVLNAYLDALTQLAKGREAHSVSLFLLESPRGLPITSDGIHLNDLGYRLAAERIVRDLVGQLFANPLSDLGSEQAAALAGAIRKKNELFFHRWRPENWTYLFGFRNHEQGQNAVEIPRFDPLIEEWEKRIAKLRDLKNQDPATVKEVGDLTAQSAARNPQSAARNPQSAIRNPQSAIGSPPLPTFDVATGFEVHLWAEDPLLHKPIQMNWDAQGRLWIASSEIYPQIKPGQPATDSIIVLGDTNDDGKADKSTAFATGLLIPTGVLPDSNGGCYVAASHQLLYFKDTDGDDKADEKRIVLSSFGTEDTHHNLHTLRWGYDGHIYMNQSIYTHSHIETPHGIVRLNSGGIWRFDPFTYQLEIFTRGGCNPWGHHWDQYGNSFFTDGAGFKGLYHAMEGATYFTYADLRREAESITPGNWPKFCSIELVRSPNFPDDWQGDAITCDFRAHRLARFKLAEAGSTFAGKEMPDLLRSTNVTFRPIDVRFGPDGALYIADWSNPIIQHGEVDFRDPRRDKEHGRIWRVAARSPTRSQKSEFAQKRDLTPLSNSALLDLTLSGSGWHQEQARVILRHRPVDQTIVDAKSWLDRQKDPRAKLEVMWLHEAFDKTDEALVQQITVSKDVHLRAAATRQLSR
jgi:glucose/arabinose dehydrogenase